MYKSGGKYILIFVLFSFALTSCKVKQEIHPPTALLDESRIEALTDISARIISGIPEQLQEHVIEYGHVWSEQPAIPDISHFRSVFNNNSSTTPTTISTEISGLTVNSTYNVRAYLKTASGIHYGKTVTFTTLADYISRLTQLLNDSLGGKDFGYSFIITRNDTLLGEGYGGLQSRHTDTMGEIPISLDSKMQIASMTKPLTAIAALQLFSKFNISPTAKIIDYLPEYWKKGPDIQLITFADLMKHRSGIIGSGNNCKNGAYLENTWWGLKELIEKGIKATDYGNHCYQNANFGLFRILIPAILGYQFSEPGVDNAETIKMYENYIKTMIFDQSGVQVNQFLSNNYLQPTLGYTYPHQSDEKGFDPGDFSTTTGGYGFYLSAIEAAKIYSALASPYNENILTNEQKEIFFQNGYGNFSTITPHDQYYYHDGWWHLGVGTTMNPKGFRSIWISGTDNISLVLFTNGIRIDDGLFPLRADEYFDITSFALWAFSRMHGEGLPKGRAETVNFHDYLEYPEPH